MTTVSYNQKLNEIQNSIRVLTQYHNGDVFEIRIFPEKGYKRTIAGYFDREQSYTAAKEIMRYMENNNIYIVLNPVNPDLKARAVNCLEDPLKYTTADKDVVRREWILIDVDPQRPAGISATDDEKQKAFDRIWVVRDYLTAIGWSEPIFSDSGNGFHLLYHVSLPNDAEALQLVESCLKSLAAKFDDDAVKIDTTVQNAARISKLYGSTAMKGHNTDDRPHRQSKILSLPETLEIVSMELIKALAATAPTPTTKNIGQKKSTVTNTVFDLQGFMERHGLIAEKVKKKPGVTIQELKECPYNPEHKAPDSAIFLYEDGVIGFKCQHNSCQGYHWHELREKLEPSCYNRMYASQDDTLQPKEEIKDVISGEEEKIKQQATGQKENQATVLYNAAMMECHEYFCDTQGNAYYETIENGIKRTYQVNNTEFRDYLRRLYADIKGTLPKNDTIKNVSDQIAAVIRGQNNVKEVFIRIALDNSTGDLYLDLANEKREVVKITRDGWEVTTLCPVVFRRGTGQQPLPYPVKGGTIDLLRPFLNFNDDDFILVCAFIIGVFQYGKPFILLIINGEQGSGKSTTGRVIKSLIDPCQGLDRALPREEKNIYIAAKSNWVFNYDNASNIQDWLSDALCRVATGGGWGERKKYTDDEEVVYEVKRPVILNGIYDMVERADMMDRAIVIRSLKILDGKRLTETEYYQRFRDLHPLILGAFLDAVVNCLRNQSSVNLPQKTRMADFVQWVSAAAPAIEVNRFLSVYLQNREGAREALLQGDLITDGFIRHMEGKLEWKGTANELLEAIKVAMRLAGIDPPSRPRDGRALTRHLKNIAPNIRKVYCIDIQFPEYTTKNHGRILSIIRIPPDVDQGFLKSHESTPILTPKSSDEKNIGVISECISEYEGVSESGIYSDTPKLPPYLPPFQPLKSVIMESNPITEPIRNIQNSESKNVCENVGVSESRSIFAYEEGEI
ncbi:MAG: hypothetical protein AB2L14_21150 [Candidatus Xenobiia bacterium LiM19]